MDRPRGSENKRIDFEPGQRAPGQNEYGTCLGLHEADQIDTLFVGTGGVKPNSTPVTGYPDSPVRVRVLEESDIDTHLHAGEIPLSLSAFGAGPVDYHTKTEFVQNETDVVETRNPSTGGCGELLQRDPEKVLADDHQKGIVSSEAAYEQYGVFDESGRR